MSGDDGSEPLTRVPFAAAQIALTDDRGGTLHLPEPAPGPVGAAVDVRPADPASPAPPAPRLANGLRLHVVHVSQPVEAGVATCVLQYAGDQVRRGWRITVVCPPGSWLAREASALGATVVAWAAGREIGSAVAQESLQLRRLLADLAPDLVHLHSSKAGLAGRLALRGRAPTVFQPHAWSFETLTGRTRHAALAWEREATRWTRRVLCVSAAERHAGRRAGIVADYAVVPNGVDLRRFAAAGVGDRLVARNRLGLGGAPRVVCLGRLSEQKGQDLLLRAWPAVRDRVPDARLSIVGYGPLAERLAALAAASEGVELPGATARAADWLAAADVVVVPSRYEGMALVPLEAMARARSVVASDIAPNRESVPPSAGALVPLDDAPALSDAIALRLEQPRLAEAEGRAGRAAVEARHDARLASDRLASTYAEILDEAAVRVG